jgi:Xaa-Pro aminopeptidase
MRRPLATLALAALAATANATPVRAQIRRDTGPAPVTDFSAAPTRPFGTLREQAAVRQRWLARRLETVLPALMRAHGVTTWVVPMREYNEDPVFSSLVAPTTFAARRRTIYVFHDRCAPPAQGRGPGAEGRAAGGADSSCIERLALGGTAQGGLYEAVRATKPVEGDLTGRTAELWGDEQWQVLKRVLEERDPARIAIDVSSVFAFGDGLSAGELEGMKRGLGDSLASRLVPAGLLPVELIARRLPEEEATFAEMNRLAWEIIRTAFSREVITPGVTRTQDVVWWMRQRVNDLGLGSWFHPTVDVQRRGVDPASLGDDPVILPGDVLHCDFGLVALGLHTDTQHMAYVLRDGETAPPTGLLRALAAANRLQEIVVDELRPGRTGNEILAASLARMRREGIDGTVYSHPVGMHGHGAGPLIGLWDYQGGVPGRGDAPVLAGMWYSIELQATTPVAEWAGQRVRMALEEDVIVDDGGRVRWAHARQTTLHLLR